MGTDHQRIAKLARDDEVAPPPKVAPSVGKAIGQARQALGLTQKDLGTKINEKPNVIAEYESGVSNLSLLEEGKWASVETGEEGGPLPEGGATEKNQVATFKEILVRNKMRIWI